MRLCCGGDPVQKPRQSGPVQNRAQLHLRPLSGTFAPALRRLPQPGVGIHQKLQFGGFGAQRQCRVPHLRHGRADARGRHGQRSGALRPAIRVAGDLQSARSAADARDLRTFRSALLLPGTATPEPLRRGGEPCAAAQVAHRDRDLPRLCRPGNRGRLSRDAERLRPLDG